MLNKATLVVFDGFTKERCIAAYLFAKQVYRLTRKSGLLFTALYLKQCGFSLAKAYAGDYQPDLLPVPVALTRSGYPNIIPAFHRKLIIRKDDRADQLVQLYLSWFSLAKTIQLARPFKRKDFESIVSLPKDLDTIMEVCDLVKTRSRALINRNLPWISTIPLYQGISWEPTWKAVPNIKIPKDALYPHYWNKAVKSGFLALTYELAAFGTMLQLEHAHGAFFSSGGLWRERIRFALDPTNTETYHKDMEWFEKWVGPKLPTFSQLDYTGFFGRLAMVIEGAGKRRVLAIGNYIKQRLLYPYHKWLMAVLRRIPMDGTFNQRAPLDRLVGFKEGYSLDLKSATDRWPLPFM